MKATPHCTKNCKLRRALPTMSVQTLVCHSQHSRSVFGSRENREIVENDVTLWHPQSTRENAVWRRLLPDQRELRVRVVWTPEGCSAATVILAKTDVPCARSYLLARNWARTSFALSARIARWFIELFKRARPYNVHTLAALFTYSAFRFWLANFEFNLRKIVA